MHWSIGLQFPCKRFLQSAVSRSIEKCCCRDIFFLPLPLEEMASSHEQNARRLCILLVKCLKTPPAGIGHWNVLRNRTCSRNAGYLKHKEPFALDFWRLCSEDCKTVLVGWPGLSEHHARPVVTLPPVLVTRCELAVSRLASNICSRFAELSRDRQLRKGSYSPQPSFWKPQCHQNETSLLAEQNHLRSSIPSQQLPFGWAPTCIKREANGSSARKSWMQGALSSAQCFLLLGSSNWATAGLSDRETTKIPLRVSMLHHFFPLHGKKRRKKQFTR